MREIRVNLRTLTPVWTGDARRECKRLTGTGLVGSLRWWLEAVLRGDGVPVPVDAKYDEKKGADALDPISRMFGVTGWRRRFRLVVGPHKVTLVAGDGIRGGGGVESEDIPVTVFTPHDEFDPAIVTGLLEWIAERGGIGARWSAGYGVVAVSGGSGTAAFEKWRKDLPGGPVREDRMPRLDQMFFLRCLGGDRKKVKLAIRELVRGVGGNSAEDLLMGYLNTEPPYGAAGCKIAISESYEVCGVKEIRLWGWLSNVTNVDDRLKIKNGVERIVREYEVKA